MVISAVHHGLYYPTIITMLCAKARVVWDDTIDIVSLAYMIDKFTLQVTSSLVIQWLALPPHQQ